MTSGWAFESEPPTHEPGVVTLIEQTSFCIGSRNGNIDPLSAHGLFFRDTRILSRWILTVDGATIEPLLVTGPGTYAATFIGRARMGPGPSPLLVERRRYIGTGMREDVTLRNVTADPVKVSVGMFAAADFADLFHVKEHRVDPSPDVRTETKGGDLVVTQHHRGEDRGIRITAQAVDELTTAGWHDGELFLDPSVPGHGTWTVTFEVRPVVGTEEFTPAYPNDRPIAEAPAARRAREWDERTPVITGANESMLRALNTSRRDLGALRIFDPADPSVAAVAAGAPWFMALFGRDSILTSMMALPLDPSLALGTLRMLARYQGVKEDPVTEEEPGRILHEVRLGVESHLTLGGGSIYYGTVDATPLFVVLLGELRRWGLGEDYLHELLPAADRALEWIQRYGDRTGRGFVEYQRTSDRGLQNQGWKDSHDGISFADGTFPAPPIALAEVQAYTYTAYVARAHLARELGDTEGRRRWMAAARELKIEFNRQFWLPDRGWFAVALDGNGVPVDSLTSNIGHCLWSGIVDTDKARNVADHLMAPEMFSGWGVRTLASSMRRYSPMSYHNGSVWPHDNAIIATGLMRYGFVEEAKRVASAMFDAAEAFGGRLPELFCGFDRSEYDEPIPFPTSCSPQAWAAATPLSLLRTLLRLNPSVSQGTVCVDPVFPEEMLPMRVANVPVGNARMSIDVQPCEVRIDGLTPDLTLFRSPIPTR